MTDSDDRARLEETPEEPPLDRTISPIAGRLAGAFGGKALAFAGLLTGCAVFAFATWSADRPRPPKPPDQPARQVVAFEPAPTPTLARPGPDAPSLVRSNADDVPALEPYADVAGAGTPAAPPPAPRPAPLMAWSRGPGGTGSSASPEIRLSPEPGPRTSETELDRLRRGSRIGRAVARTVGDRNFLILAGTAIPCVLQTALDSSTPGLVVCVLPQDVYSDNGAVVLLEKGARVLGEHRGGLQRGERRIFVLWTRAVTPNGVAIDLASPAADALGRGGFDGAVDTRFWDRFGAAVLLSVVDDAGDALAGGGRRRASARLPSDAAALAVESNAGIAPTLRKAQGAEVVILAAQDLDFSGVYGLRARTP